MYCLFAYSYQLVNRFHFVAVFVSVVFEPPQSGVQKFFFKSIFNSSPATSISLLRKSISLCLRPTAASSSATFFSNSLLRYCSLSICTTNVLPDCKCREYLFNQLYTEAPLTVYSLHMAMTETLPLSLSLTIFLFNSSLNKRR